MVLENQAKDRILTFEDVEELARLTIIILTHLRSLSQKTHSPVPKGIIDTEMTSVRDIYRQGMKNVISNLEDKTQEAMYWLTYV